MVVAFDAVACPDLISILAHPKTDYSLSTELEGVQNSRGVIIFPSVKQSIQSTFEYVQNMQQLGSGSRKGFLGSVC